MPATARQLLDKYSIGLVSLIVTLLVTACTSIAAAPVNHATPTLLSPISTPTPPEPTATPKPTGSPTISSAPTTLTPTATISPTASTPMTSATPQPANPAVFKPGNAALVPILMYHRLREPGPDATQSDRDWSVAPAAFEAQMAWLAQHSYQTITLDQLIAYFDGKVTLPDRPVILTFDDGWREQFDLAFPVLKKHGFTATFYVIAAQLNYAFSMNPDQLRQLRDAGMGIGSHTLSHTNLFRVNPAEAERQVQESKALLEKDLGQPVTSFCYPNGSVNDNLIEMVKKAGYTSAVSLRGGYRQTPETLFKLARIRVDYSTSLEDFVKRLPWQ